MSSRNVYMRDASGFIFTTERPDYHTECERLTRAEGQRLYAEQCAAKLREVLAPKSTVYCVLRSVSSSGMSRRISFFAVQDGGLTNLTHLIAGATSYNLHPSKEGLVVGGAGMDMGFAVVYALGSALWQNGTPAPHGTRNGEPDSTGGYALKHEWI